MGNNSRQQSVGDWDAFVSVAFGWGVGFSTLYLYLPPPMSLRRCEWRVWFPGQTTSKPSIHNAPSHGLWNCSGILKKTSDGWIFSRWNLNVCKMKGLIFHPVVWEHLCGILKVPIGSPKFPMEFPRGVVLLHQLKISSFQTTSHLPHPSSLLESNSLFAAPQNPPCQALLPLLI